MDKSLILNEIKKSFNIKTDTEFSRFLGINKSTLSMWRERNSFDIELLFSKCEQIDANFLLTGKGNVFRKVEPEPFTNEEKVKLLEAQVSLMQENKILLKENSELKIANLKLQTENTELKKVQSDNASKQIA
ncbi:helix-turn-helix domain-containing protein [Capnocytophaga canimorsus]|uniref:helix-turn-helix domain-containing protein n=1 Tax=Capnocytophaga canimorsus TaxID=28188 RepID=UPI000F514CD9|nr:helix-turn-helix domain-containing protein [Capnocytophaga canimorsus]AYW36553.1 hypothetical protein D8L92_04030 [Capnocytophaga canimorsus]